jgi:hypothetical protein
MPPIFARRSPQPVQYSFLPSTVGAGLATPGAAQTKNELSAES